MIISLEGIEPVAAGGRRYIYEHPDHPSLLIKVMRPDNLQHRWFNAPWYRRLARTGPYVSYMREFKEYLTSRRFSDEPSPVARIVGLVDTDQGLGLVSEKVTGDDGRMAPSLESMVKAQGMTPEINALINRLFEEVLRHYVIVNDLHAANVVYGTDSRGGPRLVIIDGFGEKNVLPLTSMSRRHNARRARLKFERLRAQLAAIDKARPRMPAETARLRPGEHRQGQASRAA